MTRAPCGSRLRSARSAARGALRLRAARGDGAHDARASGRWAARARWCSELVPEFERAHPGIRVARAADPVERRAREAAHRLRRRLDARRRAARQHLDPRVRGARRARAARRAASPRSRAVDARRLLPRHLGHQRRRRHAPTACPGTSTRACSSTARDLLARGRLPRAAARPGTSGATAMARDQARTAAASATPSCCRSTSGTQPVDPRAAGRRAAARATAARAATSATRASARAFELLPRPLPRRPRAAARQQRRSRTSTRSSRAATSRCTSPARGTSASSARRLPARAAGRTGRPRRCRGPTARRTRRVARRRLEPGALPRARARRTRPGAGRVPRREPDAAGALLRS